MRTTSMLLAVYACAFAAWAADVAGTPPPSLFALREMDMHLHAGLEREVPLKDWIDLAVADGRKVLLLLDHYELYDKSPKEYAAWAEDHKFKQWYPMGDAGRLAFMADVGKAAAARKDFAIFRGWEVGETDLDGPLQGEALKQADAIGFHISPNHKGQPPCGKTLLKRIAEIKQAQREFHVPMIVFHPFSMRLEHLHRKAEQAGRDPKTIPVEELRFFQPGEQDAVIRELRGTTIYIEMSYGTQGYWNFPNMREALIADIKPLADAGLQFTVSTDGHSVKGTQKPFNPEPYCEPCGITPQNANAIVRELNAAKVKRPDAFIR